MSWNRKRIVSLFGAAWFVAVFLFGAYLLLQENSIDKRTLLHHSGRVTHKELIKENTGTRFGSKTAQAFTFTLEGLAFPLQVYDREENYASLDSLIQPGDVLDVYFQTSVGTMDTAHVVYEIDKRQNIIFGEQVSRTGQLTGGVVAVLAALLVVVIAVLQDRKYWNS